MVPKHLNDPLTIIAKRVHSASHSSILYGTNRNMTIRISAHNCAFIRMIRIRRLGWHQAGYLCEVRTTARLSWITLIMEFHRKRLDRGSIPVVGSSWCTEILIWHIRTQSSDWLLIQCCWTHQEHQGGAADHGDGRGEFPPVASAVGPGAAARVLRQAQLLDGPLCHLSTCHIMCYGPPAEAVSSFQPLISRGVNASFSALQPVVDKLLFLHSVDESRCVPHICMHNRFVLARLKSYCSLNCLSSTVYHSSCFPSVPIEQSATLFYMHF